jgi:hypothetical protein
VARGDAGATPSASEHRAEDDRIKAMHSDHDGLYSKTDVVVAIILATIATLWILAYIVAFIRSGAAS